MADTIIKSTLPKKVVKYRRKKNGHSRTIWFELWTNLGNVRLYAGKTLNKTRVSIAHLTKMRDLIERWGYERVAVTYPRKDNLIVIEEQSKQLELYQLFEMQANAR